VKRSLLRQPFTPVCQQKRTLRWSGALRLSFRSWGTVGVIAMLHTWDQTLKDHFHLHALIPAGALSFDHSHWLSACKNFLFPVTSLSRVFRGKFLDLLKQNIDRGKRS
jgi:hypothetical protein